MKILHPMLIQEIMPDQYLMEDTTFHICTTKHQITQFCFTHVLVNRRKVEFRANICAILLQGTGQTPRAYPDQYLVLGSIVWGTLATHVKHLSISALAPISEASIAPLKNHAPVKE